MHVTRQSGVGVLGEPTSSISDWRLRPWGARKGRSTIDGTRCLLIEHNGPVEIRIDLDATAMEIIRRTDGWRARGIEVKPITWREQAEGWPQKLKTDRSEVISADSIGVALRKGDLEGEIVLFNGGWADLAFWDGHSRKLLQEMPGWEDWMDLDAFGHLLDRFGLLFV